MKKESVLELKQEVLTTLAQPQWTGTGVGTESLVSSRLESRLAVGYSELGKGQYWLELRVQRGHGPAYRLAEEIRGKAAGEARVEVIPRIEMPTKKALTDMFKGSKSLTKRQRPLHIGVSIGPREGGAGTLGAFVETDSGIALLSNNHVLAQMGRAEMNEPIFQPGRPDVQTLMAANKVAKLTNYAEISRTDRNFNDSAIARLEPGVDHLGNTIPDGLGCPHQGKRLSRVGDYSVIAAGETVCKIGRSTGFTRGVVTAIALDNVPILTSIGNVLFDNMLEITWESNQRPFSRDGDSGSVVFIERGLVAVGLHCAGGFKKVGDGGGIGVSYSCDLTCVLNDCDATLVA